MKEKVRAVKGKIQVGEYIICRMTKETVWIEHISGEGMQIPEKMLEKSIKDLWRKFF